jgi:HD-like signal output (HDOD) protein
MHHLGVLMEAVNKPTDFRRALVLSEERGCSLQEAETEIFGFGHSECGAALLERWKSPQMMVDAALYHLNPEACPNDPKPAQVVHLAAMLCHELGGQSYEGVAPWFSEQVFHKLGWSLESLPSLQERIQHAIGSATHLHSALTED